MRRHAFTGAIAVTVSIAIFAAGSPARAQAPPDKRPAEPHREMRDPKACVNARATIDEKGGVGLRDPKDRSLSEHLARSDGVICPPPAVDPAIKAPTPDAGNTPVIPPPGASDPTVRPK